jgi:hypothetical protein
VIPALNNAFYDNALQSVFNFLAVRHAPNSWCNEVKDVAMRLIKEGLPNMRGQKGKLSYAMQHESLRFFDDSHFAYLLENIGHAVKLRTSISIMSDELQFWVHVSSRIAGSERHENIMDFRYWVPIPRHVTKRDEWYTHLNNHVVEYTPYNADWQQDFKEWAGKINQDNTGLVSLFNTSIAAIKKGEPFCMRSVSYEE